VLSAARRNIFAMTASESIRMQKISNVTEAILRRIRLVLNSRLSLVESSPLRVLAT
jgi:hypothetical protein